MIHDQARLCILTAGETKDVFNRGETVWDDGLLAIVAKHEAGTGGGQVRRILLIEPQHREFVAWFDHDLDGFKTAYHQIMGCDCRSLDLNADCLDGGEHTYAGPRFTKDSLNSMCYIDTYYDDLCLLGATTGSDMYTNALRANLQNDPNLVKTLIESLRLSGDWKTHEQRRAQPAE